MNKRTRMRTVVRKHEVYVLRTAGGSNRVVCAECPGVALVSLEEAVRIAGVTARTLYRWIEAESVHFAETGDGLTLLCPASLLRRASR